MHWLQHKKPELLSMDHFGKNEIWRYGGAQKKLDPFHRFSGFRLKNVIKQGQFLLHLTQWINALHIILEKRHKDWRFWKVRKNGEKGPIFVGPLWWLSFIFFQNGSSKLVPFFLRCNQCIKARFFWAIKNKYRKIFQFCHHRGGILLI